MYAMNRHPMYSDFGPPAYQAGEADTCIYCSNPLPASSREHVFNACWGGVHKTSKLICDDCNQSFSGIDKALAKHGVFTMNAWGTKGQRHSTVPKIDLEGDYELESGTKPILEEPKMEVAQGDDGSLNISLLANSKSEARRELLDRGRIEEVLGRELTDSETDQILSAVSQAWQEEARPGKVTVPIELNLQEEYRSAAHTILKCIGLYDHEFVRSDDIEDIRKFARYGEGNWEDFAVDINELVSPSQSAIGGRFGSLFNCVDIYYSRVENIIVGVLHIMSRSDRAVCVLEDYNGPDATLTVMENTLAGGRLKSLWGEVKESHPPIPFFQVLQKPPSKETLAMQFADLVQQSFTTDALSAKLLDSISEIESNFDEINDESINEYLTTFVNATIMYSRLIDLDKSKSGIRNMFYDSGFGNLESEHKGEDIDDENVIDLLSESLEKVWEELLQEAEEAST